MTDFAETLDEIIEERSLLKHPFYQAWNAGTLPLDSLREYAKQYFHFEAAFPTFLSAIHARMEPGAARQAVLENLWDEEHGPENHLALWLRFCESLGIDEAEVRASEPNAETSELVDGFRAACS
ncbi:MAG TPA: iron-containing redox enzyme family protein, partial [Dehalococcoidia bacterium]|nr:iron-containing redox enzyme family protein [Dehalococcoidia bacterium]